jgi:hypothetical protein
MPCSREEVLILVNETIPRDSLDIMATSIEHQPAEQGTLRVDTERRTLIIERTD